MGPEQAEVHFDLTEGNTGNVGTESKACPSQAQVMATGAGLCWVLMLVLGCRQNGHAESPHVRNNSYLKHL